MSVTRLVILGSTGSIGRQALEVVAQYPDRLEVVALAAGRQSDLLVEQARRSGARYVYCASGLDPALRAHLPPGCRLIQETDALEQLATLPEADMVLVATPGRTGMRATLAALEAGKDVALANKEALVMAGALVRAACQRSGARILPVDSEHSALWQCLRGEVRAQVRQVILTASGGPFRTYTAEQLRRVTPADALAHPTWRMGPKVTIDSATLMNKGLEIIEAHWLLDLEYEKISVVVHPQSIVHSLVEFIDASVKAQLSMPDMRLPIQYALLREERRPGLTPWLDLVRTGVLTFEEPDTERFPCLALARQAGVIGGTAPTVLCSADEEAVAAFLAGRISFPAIAEVVGRVLARHAATEVRSLDDVVAADEWARQQAQQEIALVTSC
jgi:1-deoxy-D-xylulose-5-phosphate reductoisomerase